MKKLDEMKYKSEKHTLSNGYKVIERVLDLPEEEAMEHAKTIKKLILEYSRKRGRIYE